MSTDESYDLFLDRLATFPAKMANSYRDDTWHPQPPNVTNTNKNDWLEHG